MARKSQDRTLAIITHVIGIFAYIIGALIIFLLTKDKQVKKHARNALNWQISLAVYATIIFLLSVFSGLIMSFTVNVVIFIPFAFLISALNITNIVFCIIAAVKANEGVVWKYPLSIDFIEKIGEKNIEKGKKEFKEAAKEVKTELKIKK